MPGSCSAKHGGHLLPKLSSCASERCTYYIVELHDFKEQKIGRCVLIFVDGCRSGDKTWKVNFKENFYWMACLNARGEKTKLQTLRFEAENIVAFVLRSGLCYRL